MPAAAARAYGVVAVKLFVWEGDGVLTYYTNGQIVAIAPDLEKALLAIERECPSCMRSFPNHRPSDVIDLGDCPGVEPRAWVCYGGV